MKHTQCCGIRTTGIGKGYPCGTSATVNVDGQWYCKNHSPAIWQSLSDDEIDNIWSMNFEFGFRACARAIEQTLKEKNYGQPNKPV